MNEFWRYLLIGLLVVVLVLGWWKGEHRIRRSPSTIEGVVDLVVGLWRFLMLVVSVVAVVTVVGLWSAQDASQEAARNTKALCESVSGWQSGAIEARRADVRIAEAELADAEAEIVDAQVAIDNATAEGIIQNQFIGPYLMRDLRRATARKAALELELGARQAAVERFEVAEIDGCPPSAPPDTTTPTTS